MHSRSFQSECFPSEVIIVTDNAGGHRLTYVRMLALYAIQHRLTVRVLCSGAVRSSEEWALHLGDIEAQLVVVEVARPDAKSARELARFSPASRTVVPDGDAWLRTTLGGFRRWPGSLSIVMMRPASQSKRLIKRIPGAALKALLRAVARMRRGVRVHVLATSFSHPAHRSRFVRDPIEVAPDQSLAAGYRTEWTAFHPGTDRWFGVVGALTERKNVGLVIDALCSVRASGCPVGLVLAGRSSVNSSVELSWSEAARDGGLPVIRIDRLMPDVELDSLIASVDCVVLAHSNEGSSGIMGKAAALGTSVLAAGAVSLRTDCRLLGSGAEWVPLSVRDVADGMLRVARGPSPRRVAVGSPAEFAETLLATTLRDGTDRA